MRVTATTRNKSIATVEKKKKTQGNTEFAEELASSSQNIEDIASLSLLSVSTVNPLFALQEVNADSEGKKKYIKDAKKAMEYLDDIRLGLLSGSIGVEKIKQLDHIIASWRERTDDSDLNAILDEIETRAAVELAKLGY